jgi:hypothetical protein
MTLPNPGYPTAQRRAMHARLEYLLGRWLLTAEASELRFLAAELGIELHWQRYDLNTGTTTVLPQRKDAR